MIKNISYIIYKILKFFDNFLIKITKRSILIWFKDFMESDAYKKVKLKGINKEAIFFAPNYVTSWLVDEFYIKEPETIDWIDSFQKNNKKIIFWDIGANIGIYSVYAALKHSDIEVVSFEPSTSNLRILSRNIFINNLENKIKINQFPLTKTTNNYSLFRESKFGEGESLNSFDCELDFEGKKINSINSYKIFGTSINYLLDKNILEIPNYIKIDVDGIEHLILEGGSNYLQNPSIKSLSIELNENYEQQFKFVIKIMKDKGFKVKCKKRNEKLPIYKNKDFLKIYNYIFEK